MADTSSAQRLSESLSLHSLTHPLIPASTLPPAPTVEAPPNPHSVYLYGFSHSLVILTLTQIPPRPPCCLLPLHRNRPRGRLFSDDVDPSAASWQSKHKLLAASVRILAPLAAKGAVTSGKSSSRCVLACPSSSCLAAALLRAAACPTASSSPPLSLIPHSSTSSPSSPPSGCPAAALLLSPSSPLPSQAQQGQGPRHLPAQQQQRAIASPAVSGCSEFQCFKV